MNPLPIHALQILNQGGPIFAELPPTRPDLRKWVKLSPTRKSETRFRYVIQSFELLAYQVEQEIDVAGFEENYVLHKFETLEGALVVLEELAPGPVEWQSGRETECPI